MSSATSPLDPATVRRIARLARLRLADGEVAQLQGELGTILGWIEQLSEVDVSGVDPLANIGAASLPMREDRVTDGDQVDAVLANAPARSGPFFTVPKVVE
ncbi:Asp-tRNA(Asn)/Glu-tRNA(Gln) amidotransferase subunit GatC [Acidisoma sp. C75]